MFAVAHYFAGHDRFGGLCCTTANVDLTGRIVFRNAFKINAENF